MQSSPASPVAHDSLTTTPLTRHEQDVHSPLASPGVTTVTQDDPSDHSPLSSPAVLDSAADILYNSPQTTQGHSTSVDTQTMDVCPSSPAKQDDITARTHSDMNSIALSPCVSANALVSPLATQDNLVPSPQSTSCSTTPSLLPSIQKADPPTTSSSNTRHSLLASILNDHSYFRPHLNLLLSPSPSVSVLPASRHCEDECLTVSPQTISSTASDTLLRSPTSQDKRDISMSDCEMLDSPPPRPPPVHENRQSEDELLAYSPLPSSSATNIPASPQKDLSNTVSDQVGETLGSQQHSDSVLDSSSGMSTRSTILFLSFPFSSLTSCTR